MTTPVISCAFCRHFKPEIRDQNVCDAFPEGIPREIIAGENHHIEPVPGDGGIRFEPIPGFEDVFETIREAVEADPEPSIGGQLRG